MIRLKHFELRSISPKVLKQTVSENVDSDPNEIEVWTLDFERLSPVTKELWPMLSHDERERALKFSSQQLQNRYVATRLALRFLLGQKLDTDPAKLKFRYGIQGKPELDSDINLGSVPFNISHSQELGILAIAHPGMKGTIGVDVEKLRPVKHMALISRRFFSSRENRALSMTPSAKKTEVFFRLWCAKEAYTKARGENLFRCMSEIEIKLQPDATASIVSIHRQHSQVGDWVLSEWIPKSGYTACLVCSLDVIGIRRQ
jgi:4'-phosphopantetheinyl transferase